MDSLWQQNQFSIPAQGTVPPTQWQSQNDIPMSMWDVTQNNTTIPSSISSTIKDKLQQQSPVQTETLIQQTQLQNQKTEKDLDRDKDREKESKQKEEQSMNERKKKKELEEKQAKKEAEEKRKAEQKRAVIDYKLLEYTYLMFQFLGIRKEGS